MYIFLFFEIYILNTQLIPIGKILAFAILRKKMGKLFVFMKSFARHSLDSAANSAGKPQTTQFPYIIIS